MPQLSCNQPCRDAIHVSQRPAAGFGSIFRLPQARLKPGHSPCENNLWVKVWNPGQRLPTQTSVLIRACPTQKLHHRPYGGKPTGKRSWGHFGPLTQTFRDPMRGSVPILAAGLIPENALRHALPGSLQLLLGVMI